MEETPSPDTLPDPAPVPAAESPAMVDCTPTRGFTETQYPAPPTEG